ncbi:STAS domain-containing protein [Mesobacillus campisalis]|nr:STAS domain-containing protein [Mesobacillus campisalis]
MENQTYELEIMKETIQKLNERVASLEDSLNKAAIPIIPSIVPSTILIPFAGELTPERFQMVIPKILDYASKDDIDTAVIDFTAISVKEVGDLAILGTYIEQLNSSLNLMGVQVIAVGFSPEFSRELVQSGLGIIKELKAFANFRAALQYLLKKKGLEIALVK